MSTVISCPLEGTTTVHSFLRGKECQTNRHTTFTQRIKRIDTIFIFPCLTCCNTGHSNSIGWLANVQHISAVHNSVNILEQEAVFEWRQVSQVVPPPHRSIRLNLAKVSHNVVTLSSIAQVIMATLTKLILNIPALDYSQKSRWGCQRLSFCLMT